MAEEKKAPLDLDQIEIILGNVLRYGVLLCALVIIIGITLGTVRPASHDTTLRSFIPRVMHGETVEHLGTPQTLGDFLRLSNYRDPNWIVSLGIFLLILLPVTRVALTIVIFIVDKDRIYVALTVFVLAVLLFGIFFGKAL